MMTRRLIAASLAVALAASTQASAHHSGAMFDHTKTVAVSGVVKEFKWSNPHASIELMTANADGVMEQWSFEGSTPNILSRKGWTGQVLKPGDKIALVMHPMKNGGHAGLTLAVTLPSGDQLKDHDY